MTISYEVCLSLWHDALASEDGLGITPDDGDLNSLKQAMYRAREKSRDMRLHEYSVFIDPDLQEVWICKKLMNPLPRSP